MIYYIISLLQFLRFQLLKIWRVHINVLYGDCVKEELKKEILNSKYYKKVHFYLYSNKDDIPSFYYLKGIKRTLTELSIPFDEDFLDLNKNDKGNINIFKTNSKDKMVVLARALPSSLKITREEIISFI